MRTLEEIKKILKEKRNFLEERFRVKNIGIFGSYIHNEGKESNDLDLLIEYHEPIGWEIVDLIDYLEGILGVKVDLVTRNALRPELSRSILNEVVYT